MPKKATSQLLLTYPSLPTGGGVKSKRNGQGKKSKAQNGKKNGQRARDTLYAPVNMGTQLFSGRPRFTANSSHSIVVAHRELLGDVYGRTLFTIDGDNQIRINPGLDVAFPWLGSIARKFESYHFRRLDFCYEPYCPTSTPGRVYMAMDYDVNDVAPVTKSELTSYNGCVQSQAWMPSRLVCDPRDINKMCKERYTRGSAISAVADLKTYDVGTFFLGTYAANPNATAWGDLFIEYEVELFTPQAAIDEIAENSSKISSGGTVSKTAPFGDAPTILGELAATVTSGNMITFPEAGEYLLSWLVGGTGLTTTYPTITTSGANVTTSQHFGELPNAAGTLAQGSAHVKTYDKLGAVTFDFTPGSTTVTSSILSAAKYLYSL